MLQVEDLRLPAETAFVAGDALALMPEFHLPGASAVENRPGRNHRFRQQAGEGAAVCLNGNELKPEAIPCQQTVGSNPILRQRENPV